MLDEMFVRGKMPNGSCLMPVDLVYSEKNVGANIEKFQRRAAKKLQLQFSFSLEKK